MHSVQHRTGAGACQEAVTARGMLRARAAPGSEKIAARLDVRQVTIEAIDVLTGELAAG
jgi:hypothetical protein